jgi:hypothetical protein
MVGGRAEEGGMMPQDTSHSRKLGFLNHSNLSYRRKAFEMSHLRNRRQEDNGFLKVRARAFQCEMGVEKKEKEDRS